MSYSEGKERARNEAFEWQADFPNHNYYWSEMAEFSDHFSKLAKRYGLVREFRENGII